MQRLSLRTGLILLSASLMLALFGTVWLCYSSNGAAVDDSNDAEALVGNRAFSKAVPEGVKVERDLAYGPDSAQKIDIYLPQKASNAPVIFMVHGGAWQIGDKGGAGVVVNKVARWVPQGFVVISVNYRMVPKAGPLEQADDVGRALAFAQAHAQSWGADPGRFILIGHSAGGHLVDLLSADPTIAFKQGAKPWLGTVSLDSAGLDVVARMETSHQRFWDQAFGSDAKYWKAASPLYRLTKATQPMLLVCSSLRRDSRPQNDAFAARATQLGSRVTVLPVPLMHGPINSQLGLPGKYTEAVEAFIKGLLGSGEN